MENFIYKTRAGVTALSASLKNFSHKIHSHEEYSLGVTLHGVREYYLDGCLQSSSKGGVMLFNQEQLHDCRASKHKNEFDYVMIYIMPKLFLEALGEKDIITFATPVTYDRKLAQDVLMLSNAILTQKDEAFCSELLIKVANNFTSKHICSNHKKDNTFLKKAKELMYYEIGNVLKLDNICNELNMSKFKFIRFFKEKTGVSPYQFFLNSKVIRAKNYLEKNKDLYGTIVEFGFTDLSHLNRHFKRIYGITAFEYLSYLN